MTTTTCHDCGCELHIYEIAIIVGKPAVVMAECTERSCELYKVTLELSHLQTLSDKQREGYRKVRRNELARDGR